MRIGGVSDYSSMFSNYKVPEIPSVDIEQLKRTEEVSGSQTLKAEQSNIQKSDAQTQSVNDIDLSIEENVPVARPNADVREISLTFNAGEDFGYIGQDSNIENLDMQKAISDMKKDQILQQYQYFVGGTENFLPQSLSEDGMVFLKF